MMCYPEERSLLVRNNESIMNFLTIKSLKWTFLFKITKSASHTEKDKYCII